MRLLKAIGEATDDGSGRRGELSEGERIVLFGVAELLGREYPPQGHGYPRPVNRTPAVQRFVGRSVSERAWWPGLRSRPPPRGFGWRWGPESGFAGGPEVMGPVLEEGGVEVVEELFAGVAAVGADGVGGDVEGAGDVFVVVAVYGEGEDLDLSGGEGILDGLPDCDLSVSGQWCERQWVLVCCRWSGAVSGRGVTVMDVRDRCGIAVLGVYRTRGDAVSVS
uniref:hypothetical protein n=1 Tax=Streptomyces sp. NBC_01001 TaxID=2903713 RepID=UPI002F91B5B0|nr:hypothetical protein OG296_37010 [Streptomyces sp. NBC_01001]